MFTKVLFLEQINLDNLVPFKNYPIEKLGGKLLRDAKDELRSTKPYEPILVRKLELDVESKGSDLYEILDGHYKVAAAKELGWATISANNLGWLSEDDALNYIPDWEPVGMLYKYGIDIYSVDYEKSVEYNNIANKKISIGEPQYGYSMPFGEYINRYLLTNKADENEYESKFTMGNPQELDEKDCTYYQGFSLIKNVLKIGGEITVW